MKSIMICIIGLCFAILANVVSGNACEEFPATQETFQAPFTFAFMRGDFNLIVRLRNASPTIISIAVAIYADGELMSNEHWDPQRSSDYLVCGGGDPSSFDHVTVSLELYSSDGLCARRLVSEGRHVRTFYEYGPGRSTYMMNNLCVDLSDNACVIYMDLSHVCVEMQTDPNAKPKKKSQNIPDTTRRIEPTAKSKIIDTPKRNKTELNPITPKRKMPVTPKLTEEYPDNISHSPITPKQNDYRQNITTPQVTQNISTVQQAAQNKSDTQNGTQTADLKHDDADVKMYIIITIISAVSLMALILIVVVVRKCSCIKQKASVSSQLLANDLGSPFYLNMLFRKECDQEIELNEQHLYEEIPPSHVSAAAANLNGESPSVR